MILSNRNFPGMYILFSAAMLVFRGCLQEHLVSQSEIFGFQKSCYAKCVFHQKPQDFDHAEACAGGGSLGGVFFQS